MNLIAIPTLALAGSLLPQGPAPDAAARFAAPVRIHAGDALLGEDRYYPSPVLHDIDGDGLLDIVVGDLAGKVTVARRQPSNGGGIAFGEEEPLLDRRGEQVKFHNW